MTGWYRMLVLVGAGSLLTGCLDGGLKEAVAEAESQLDSANLALAKEQKNLADAKANVEALQAENAGLKAYASQVEDYLAKEMEALKATRAADQTVFQNRQKGKGSFVGEIRTATGVYGPGKISDFLVEGILIEQASGVKQVPYNQLPADMQNLYVLKPYQPGPAPVMAVAVAAAALPSEKGTGAKGGTRTPKSAAGSDSEKDSPAGPPAIQEEIPSEVASLISPLKISDVTDSYLRNLLVDSELNVDRVRKKKAAVAAMEAKLGPSTGAELTAQKQAAAALNDRKRALQNEIYQLERNILSAENEMSSIPGRVSGSYSGSIRPSAAQIKAETEKQSKAYRDAIAQARGIIAQKQSQVTALESERIAVERKVSDLEQIVVKNRAEQVDLEYERKDLQRLIDNQRALFLQIQARDAEMKKQNELIKDLRR